MASKWVLFCGVCCFILYHLILIEAKKQKELEIITEFVPEDCQEKSAEGDEISVHYTGSLENGQVFDSSRPRGETFGFALGQRKVIPGWDIGLQNMCVGEKRKLIIPPHLGYGSRGAPPRIPPDATLVFETELLGIQKGSTTDQTIFRLIRFLGFPTAAGIIVYFLYNKYQKEIATTDQKDKNKGGRKKRK